MVFRGPYTQLYDFVTTFNKVQFTCGGAESQSFASEGLAMSLRVFDNLEALREREGQVPKEHSKHIIYIGNSSGYEIPVSRYLQCALLYQN